MSAARRYSGPELGRLPFTGTGGPSIPPAECSWAGWQRAQRAISKTRSYSSEPVRFFPVGRGLPSLSFRSGPMEWIR